MKSRKEYVMLSSVGVVAVVLGILAEGLFHWMWGSWVGLVVGIVAIILLMRIRSQPDAKNSHK